METTSATAPTKRKAESQFRPNGVCLRNDRLTLSYQKGKPLFKSIGRKNANLAKMGIHRRDGDFLCVEAALYLMEQGAALVVDHLGNPLAIQQIYALLGQLNVSYLKYAVFVQMVRAGYTVRRPELWTREEKDTSSGGKQSTAMEQKSSNNTKRDSPLSLQPYCFPQELLDQFPSIQTKSCVGRATELSLHLPPISFPQSNDNDGRPATSVVLFAGDKADAQLDLPTLNGQLDERIWQSQAELLNGVRRWNRRPWDQHRPRHWPSFHTLRSADNWRMYQQRREVLMRTVVETRGNGNSNGRMGVGLAQKRRTTEPHDYELYASNCTAAAKPLYCVLVVDERFRDGHPNFAELVALSSSTSTAQQQQKLPSLPTLLVATGTPTCVRINEVILGNETNLGVPTTLSGEEAEQQQERNNNGNGGKRKRQEEEEKTLAAGGITNL